MGVAGDSGRRLDLVTLTGGASTLSSLPDETIRKGGGRAGADGLGTESTGGIEAAPGSGEKLPRARA